jgi:hypothetical protein
MSSSVASIFTDLDFSQDFEIREQQLRELEERIRAVPDDARAALASHRGSKTLNG